MTRIGRFRSLSVLVVVLSAISAAFDVPVQAGTDPSLYSWVVVRKPGTGTSVPGPGDQANGSGNTNTVVREAAGLYLVSFPGVGHYPCGGAEPYGCLGMFTVSALSKRQRICTFGNFSFDLSGTNHAAQTYVECRGRDGIRHDSGFTVSFFAAREHPGRIAYLFADKPSDPGDITDKWYNHAQSAQSYNTSGRTGTGRYKVWLDGVEAADGGNVQLTSTDGWCRVTGREHEIMTTSYVFVACRDWSGHLVDTLFSLRYTEDVGIEGQFGDGPTTYLWADRPTTASYRPASAFRHSSAGLVPTIKRTDVGRYVAKLPGMPARGVAHVTAYGAGGSRCQVTSIRTDGTPQRIGVRCFRPNGVPVDSAFYLTYAH